MTAELDGAALNSETRGTVTLALPGLTGDDQPDDDLDDLDDDDEVCFSDTPTMEMLNSRERYLDEFAMEPVSTQDRKLLNDDPVNRETKRLLSLRESEEESQKMPDASTASSGGAAPENAPKGQDPAAPNAAFNAGSSWQPDEEEEPVESHTATWSFEVERVPDEPQDPLHRSEAHRDDEELQIQAYMQQLMGRNSPEPPEQPAVTKPAKAPPATPSAEGLADEPFLPRRHAPEAAENLKAMRELANTSAQQALRASASKGGLNTLGMQMGGGVIALVVAGAAGFAGWAGNSYAYLVAAIAAGVAFLWLFQAFSTLAAGMVVDGSAAEGNDTRM